MNQRRQGRSYSYTEYEPSDPAIGKINLFFELDIQLLYALHIQYNP